MNFLNSVILFGLGAAVIPLVIHLLSKRNTQETVFPSIRFLEWLKSDRIRLLRLKQFFVILLRTLIISLIVLAFARPALKSAFESSSPTAAAIIVDNSASMFYVDNGELLYDRALRKAGDIIDFLREDDTAAIVFTGDDSHGEIPRVYDDPEELTAVLENAAENPAAADPASAFSRALDALKSSGLINKELYYITDAAVESIPDSLNTDGESVRLYVMTLGPDERNGRVVTDITLVDKLVAPGRTLTFAAEVSGDTGGSNDVEFFVNGERKGRAVPDESGWAEFTYVPDVSGWYSVYAAVNDGYFGQGEVRRLVRSVPETVKILIAGESREDTFYLEKALIAGTEDMVFDVRSITGENIEQDDLFWADVIVFSGINDIPKTLYRALLAEIADHGKGFMVFPGADVETSLYADGIFRDMFPVQILTGGVLRTGRTNRIETFDLNHPVLSEISRDGEFAKPETSSYIRMASAANISVLARFDNGDMAAGVTDCGKGAVLMFAVGADTGTGDVAVSGIFSPLIVRAAQYLSGTLSGSFTYTTGESGSVNIGSVTRGTQVTVKPEGLPPVLVEYEAGPNGAIVSTGKFSAPGFYVIYAGTFERARFCVNTPRSEIVYTRAGERAMAQSFGELPWKTVTDTESVTDIVTADRYGRELFSVFIICAVALVCVEMVLSRKV